VISYIQNSHVTHVNESRHTFVPINGSKFVSLQLESDTSVAYIKQSCHTCEWVMARIWVSHISHMYQSSVRCCGSNRAPPSHIWRIRVTHVNESCHTYEWVVSQICSHRVCVAEARVSPSSHIWRGHGTLSCVNFMSGKEGRIIFTSRRTREWNMLHKWRSQMGHVAYMKESFHMGWLRLVGSIKL